eukprot:m.194743 g.194743  ORF g.194743 m.194743 type:complete len:146 (+) comp10075_c3_seq2:401-838(+)
MVLLCMLDLYARAIRAHNGDYHDIGVATEVYDPIARLCHIGVDTAKRFMEGWLASHEKHDPADPDVVQGVDHDVNSIEELLLKLATTRRRGPKPQPFRTFLVGTNHVQIVRNFLSARLAAGKTTYCRDVRSMLRDHENDPVSPWP